MGRKDQPLKRPNSEGTRHGGGAKLVFSSLVLEASAVAMVASTATTGACVFDWIWTTPSLPRGLNTFVMCYVPIY